MRKDFSHFPIQRLFSLYTSFAEKGNPIEQEEYCSVKSGIVPCLFVSLSHTIVTTVLLSDPKEERNNIPVASSFHGSGPQFATNVSQAKQICKNVSPTASTPVH